MSFLINLKNITKIYSNGFLALKNIDFTLSRGEMIAIIGASGSGKSTLMNIMGFLDRVSRGSYFFSGKDVSTLPDSALATIRNQKVGFVFQSFFLLPRLTALQNVMLPLFYREGEDKLAQTKALMMLKKVGMDNFAHQKPQTLSGGQQQRVAIARALVGDPDVIFADEPTGALDSETGADVMKLLLKLNSEENRSIVVVTHDPVVSSLCQRVVTLKDGRMVV